MQYPPIEALRKLVADELRQREEEGCAVSAEDVARVRTSNEREVLLEAYARATRSVPRDDFPYCEPSDLAGILGARALDGTPRVFRPRPDSATVADRIHGAWLGRCAGCALGKPLESPPFMTSAANVRTYLRMDGSYPLTDFVRWNAEAARAVGLESMHSQASQRGNVRFMESDDDLRYTIMGLDILETKGAGFDTRDVAHWWMWYLPAARCFTAEEAAYRNIALLGKTHDTGGLSDDELEFARSHMNPYREWIGAQIRADGWGLACPGDPGRAAEFAWRDARLSHAKNGIYGEMFCAAMIAAALVLDEPLEVVRAGLAQIPARSRLAEAVRRTVSECGRLEFDAARFEDGIGFVWREFGGYDPVHTINNAAAVVMALLLGGRDYEKVISTAVMCGLDPDCNGATAGCISGALLGASQLPAKWIAPLNDTLWSEIPGYHPISIRACAERHVAAWKKLSVGDAGC